MNEELKLCKYCNKEKPIKDFTKSGFSIKNICKECSNKRYKEIRENSKKYYQLQQENQQLKEQLQQKEDIIKKAIEYIKKEDLYEVDFNLHDATDKYAKKDLLEILDNKGE